MRVRLSFFFTLSIFLRCRNRGDATEGRGPPSLAEAWRLRQGGRPKAFLRQVAARRRRLLSSWSFLSQITTLLPSLPFSQPCSLSPSRFAPITMRSISSLVLLALCLAVAVSAAAAAEGESFVDSQREWFRNEMRRRGPQPPPLLLQLRPIPCVTRLSLIC